MRTIEEIKDEIRYIEKELARFKTELFGLEFLGTDKPIYEDIQERIAQLQNEINSDIGYIKTVYNQLLAIKARAELLVRENANQESIEISEKVHEAFLLLIEFNKTLGEKIANRKALIEERDQLIKKSETMLPAQITQTQEKLWTLQKVLINAERQESISEKATSRIIEELQTYQKAVSPIEEIATRIKEKNEELNILRVQSNNNAPDCIQCKTKMDLYIDHNKQTTYYVCPKNKEILDKKLKHKTIHCSNKGSFENILKELEKLKHEKAEEESNITIKKPAITLTKKEKEAFQNASIQIGEYPEFIAEKYQNLVADEYPNILTTDYKNYLFQSLAIPVDISVKDHFDELLKYSRFRIFTNLPSKKKISDRERTVYSLALRLLNRGVVLNTNKYRQKMTK